MSSENTEIELKQSYRKIWVVLAMGAYSDITSVVSAYTSIEGARAAVKEMECRDKEKYLRHEPSPYYDIEGTELEL